MTPHFSSFHVEVENSVAAVHSSADQIGDLQFLRRKRRYRTWHAKGRVRKNLFCFISTLSERHPEQLGSCIFLDRGLSVHTWNMSYTSLWKPWLEHDVGYVLIMTLDVLWTCFELVRHNLIMCCCDLRLLWVVISCSRFPCDDMARSDSCLGSDGKLGTWYRVGGCWHVVVIGLDSHDVWNVAWFDIFGDAHVLTNMFVRLFVLVLCHEIVKLFTLTRIRWL